VDVSKLIEKASIAAERGNYDYAMDLYLRLLELQPQHVDARKALRAVEMRKLQERGVTKSSPAGVIRGLGSLIAASLYLALRKYEKAMAACEGALKSDPYNTSALWVLGIAAGKIEDFGTAIMVFEDIRALTGNPTKGAARRRCVRVLRRLGDLYSKTQKLPLAAERLEEVLRLVPGDREAERQIRNIAAQRSMAEGGWDKAGKQGGYRDVLKDEDSSKRLEESQRDIRTREDIMAAIERVKADLASEPENTRHLVQLGDLYRMLKDWRTAHAQYARAFEIDPQNFMVSERLGDLKLSEMDEQIERLAADPSQKEPFAQLRKERMRFAFEEYQKRVKARPQDLPTRYALANVLFEAKHYKEASVQFQHASRDPKHRRTSLYRLGVCFQRQGMVDLAIEQFHKAVMGASLVDQEVKEILFALGEAHEAQGRLTEALGAYKRIFEIDINFANVSSKMEELYKRGVKEAS